MKSDNIMDELEWTDKNRVFDKAKEGEMAKLLIEANHWENEYREWKIKEFVK